MKANTITVLASILFATKVTSLPSDASLALASGPALPYPTGSMHWTGSVNGGSERKVNGTIEQVISHLMKTEPTFDLAGLMAKDSKRDIEERTPTVWNCDPPVPRASWYEPPFDTTVPVEDAIRYLKGVGGTCGCDAHTCCRVSCSWNTAVYLCNDHDYRLEPACNYLGNPMVQIVADHCVFSVDGYMQVRGKVWDTDSFTITVQGGDNC